MSSDVISSLLDVAFDALAKAKDARVAAEQIHTARRPADDVRSAAAWAYQLYFASITLFLDVLAARPPPEMEALITDEVSGMLKTAETLRQMALPASSIASHSAGGSGPSSSAAAMPSAGSSTPSRPAVSIRQRVAEELLSTERAYVRHLTDLRDVFARPLAPPGWRDVTATVSPRSAASSASPAPASASPSLASAASAGRAQPSPSAGSAAGGSSSADASGGGGGGGEGASGGRGLSRIGAAFDGVIGRIGSIFGGGNSGSGSANGGSAAQGHGSGAGSGRARSRSSSPAAGTGAATARSAAVAGAPSHGPSNLLSADEHATLFDAVCQLLPLHEVLLQQLEALMGENGETWAAAEASGASSGVARTLARYAPFFKLYTDVCRTHDVRDRMLTGLMESRGGFASFVSTAVTSPRCRGQSLPSYLILPIQRVPRYRLLMERLLEATPVTHPERGELETCLRTVSAVAEELNGKLRLCEAQARVADVSYRFLPPQRDLVKPHRHLESEGQLDIVAQSGELQTVTLFLFNDVYILGSPPLPMVSLHIARSGIVEFLSVTHTDADEALLRRVSGPSPSAGAAGTAAAPVPTPALSPSGSSFGADAAAASGPGAAADAAALAATAPVPAPAGYPFTVSGRQQSLTFVAKTAEERQLWMGRFSECIDRLFRAQAARRMSMAAAVGAAAAAAAGVGGCGAGLSRAGYPGSGSAGPGSTIAVAGAAGSGPGAGTGSGSSRSFAGIAEGDGEGEGGDLDEAGSGDGGDAECPVAAAALAAVEHVMGPGTGAGISTNIGAGSRAAQGVTSGSVEASPLAHSAASAATPTFTAGSAASVHAMLPPSAPFASAAAAAAAGGSGTGASAAMPSVLPRATVSAGATLSSFSGGSPLSDASASAAGSARGVGVAPLGSPGAGAGPGTGAGAGAGRSFSSGALLSGGTVSLAGPRAPSASGAFGGARASLPVSSGTSLLLGSDGLMQHSHSHGHGHGHAHGLSLDIGTPTATASSAGIAVAVAAPVMQPDNARETCTGCGQAWSLFRRRHHCRLCGLLVCDECSQARTKLPGSREVVRVCDACDEQMKQPAMAAAQAQVAAQAGAFLAAEAAAFVAAGIGGGGGGGGGPSGSVVTARPMSIALGVPFAAVGRGAATSAQLPDTTSASASAPASAFANATSSAMAAAVASAPLVPVRPQRAISAFPADAEESSSPVTSAGAGGGVGGVLTAATRPAEAALARQLTSDPAAHAEAIRPAAAVVDAPASAVGAPENSAPGAHAADAQPAAMSLHDNVEATASAARHADDPSDEPRAPSPALGSEPASNDVLQSVTVLPLGPPAAALPTATVVASGSELGLGDSEPAFESGSETTIGVVASTDEVTLPPAGPLSFALAETTDPGVQ